MERYEEFAREGQDAEEGDGKARAWNTVGCAI
jgi:hypothetical protein